MPIVTYVENGELVGYLPAVGATARVPLKDIFREARASLTPQELAMLDGMSADTVGAVVDEVGAGRIARKIGKAIKKVAKNKIVKALVRTVSKAVPPPFNVAVRAAQGAAKFATALSKGKRKTRAKAKKVLPAVRAAAQGRISPKALTRAAKRAGIKPSIAADAAVIKRVAMQARTNPKAAATMRLAADITSTEPAAQMRAVRALDEADYQEPMTSRDDGTGSPEYNVAPEGLYSPPDMEAVPAEEQAPETVDPYGPDEVQPYEVDDGSPQPGSEDEAMLDVSGYGYF